MLSINELSEELGVTQSKLRRWEDFFNIPVARNIKGYREYDEFTIDIFRKIRNLVAQGVTTNEVKILLQKDLGSCQNFDNHNPKVEILEDREPQDQFMLKPFITQLDKAQAEIRELIFENAELRSQVKFFELRTKDHEQTMQRIFEFKDETITILKEENTKKETEIKDLRLKLEELNSKEEDLDSLKGQMELLNNKVLEYQQNLEAIQNKKWWKFWK